MPNNITVAFSPPKGKARRLDMLPQNTLVWCLLIVCITVLAFTLITHKSLCELRLKDGNKEVAAILAYESER
ncbi:hok/gef family protein [Yersinia rohdei]|uniref:Hok/gef family protein n=2 Tax=Yersiniaceae TaxID=1903411 RepID=A0ABM5S8W0_YERRO|nr:hok/gef family protein [Yersinia rohdei]